MTPWNGELPKDFEPNWVTPDGQVRNWLTYFFKHTADEEEATNHFIKSFYTPEQIKIIKKQFPEDDGNLTKIKNLAFKLLTKAPNLAVTCPEYGDEFQQVFILGVSKQRFQKPKLGIMYNKVDKEFYASIQPHENLLPLNPEKFSDENFERISEEKSYWLRLVNPIDSESEPLPRSLSEFISDLNAYVKEKHEFCTNDKDWPKDLPKGTPIYPRLIDETKYEIKANQEKNKKTTPKNVKEINHSMSKNIILFGPPGTGKTYTTQSIALRSLNNDEGNRELLINSYHTLLEGRLNNCTQEESLNLKELFETKINSREIVFTTFHQSYAYEDFIEGIRVRTKDEKIIYEICNGTFKQLARKALFYKAAYSIENNENLEIAASFYAEKLDVDLKDWLRTDRNNPTGVNTYSEVIEKLLRNDQNTIKKINQKASDNTPKFVLIIDEINRGNISKIFGELITLIEESKRTGGADRASVKLPSSQEIFRVPDNLYIIGTMNTADRSLATLDIALRRRFDFIEMMPKPEFLKGIVIAGINLQLWLEKLNENIQIERGREFTIGHAFFSDLKKEVNPDITHLSNIMRRKILPLLDEYFFENWEGIRRVLGDDRTNKDDEIFVKAEDKSDSKRKLYTWNLQATENANAYKKLYPNDNQ